MPKLPLSPFLLDPDAELPAPDSGQGACADHAVPPGRHGLMDLDGAELFVVATLRAWVAPMMRPGEPHPDWRELFRLAGAGMPAMLAFDGMMSVIGAQARRLIDVHCCRCPALGDDETAMLRMVAALQSGELPAAIKVLDDWLPEEAVGQALHAARCFAASIAEAGLSLPRRSKMAALPARRMLH